MFFSRLQRFSLQSLLFSRYKSNQYAFLTTVNAVEYQPTKRILEVTWDGEGNTNRVGSFPAIWLRDFCQCSECYVSAAKMKKQSLKDLDLDTSIHDVKINELKDAIHITWKCGHKSEFNSDWLLQRDFSADRPKYDSTLNAVLPLKPKLWRREKHQDMKKFQYSQFISDDKTVFNWLTAMEEEGIANIVNAPTTEDSKTLKDVIERVAFIKTTHYGDVYRVEAKPNPSNVAYTPTTLPLHLDLPFIDSAPGVQMLHFVKQPKSLEGGENTFVDGFSAAEDLRIADPEAFDWLTKTPIDYHDQGTDMIEFWMHNRKKVIELDDSGNINKIHYNDATRSSLCNVPLNHITKMYDVLKKFCLILNKKENKIEMKMNEGDIIGFNNTRVFHGRNSYTINEDATRLLIGAYMDWDGMRSRRRILAHKFNYPIYT